MGLSSIQIRSMRSIPTSGSMTLTYLFRLPDPGKGLKCCHRASPVWLRIPEAIVFARRKSYDSGVIP